MKYINFSTVLILILQTFNYCVFCDPESTSEDCKKGTDGYCLSDDINSKGCTLTPQSDEGPFFLPNQPVRQNITEGYPGIPLTVEFTVKDVKTCKPVKNATVHLWHCDAMGFYSAYFGYYPLGDPGSKQFTGAHAEPTEKATFLRGIQLTDDTGKAVFKTIFPGWYIYRPLHAHFKITIGDQDKYTGEIYFPDEFNDRVSKVEPYSKHPGKRMQNREDWGFIRDNGEALVMTPKGNFKDGLEGSMDIVIDLNSKSLDH